MSFQSLLEFSKTLIAYLQEVKRAACTLSKSNLKSAHDRTTLLFDSRGGLDEFRKKNISCKNKLETKFLCRVSTLPSKIGKQNLTKAAGLKKNIAQTFTVLLVMFTPGRFKDPSDSVFKLIIAVI